MYRNEAFKVEDTAFISQVVINYPLATVTGPGLQNISHLPLVYDSENSLLWGHFAAKNMHADAAAGQQVVAIFQGPSGYVKASLYESKKVVPTYNYFAVHFYGTLELISTEAEKESVLKKQVSFFEEEYLKTWEQLDEAYRKAMLMQVVAFKITVDQVQASAKMSQNKKPPDRQAIIKDFTPGNQQLADFMKYFSEGSTN